MGRKIANYVVGEEYLYNFETTEQIEQVHKAVEAENRKEKKDLNLDPDGYISRSFAAKRQSIDLFII